MQATGIHFGGSAQTNKHQKANKTVLSATHPSKVQISTPEKPPTQQSWLKNAARSVRSFIAVPMLATLGLTGCGIALEDRSLETLPGAITIDIYDNDKVILLNREGTRLVKWKQDNGSTVNLQKNPDLKMVKMGPDTLEIQYKDTWLQMVRVNELYDGDQFKISVKTPTDSLIGVTSIEDLCPPEQDCTWETLEDPPND